MIKTICQLIQINLVIKNIEFCDEKKPHQFIKRHVTKDTNQFSYGHNQTTDGQILIWQEKQINLPIATNQFEFGKEHKSSMDKKLFSISCSHYWQYLCLYIFHSHVHNIHLVSQKPSNLKPENKQWFRRRNENPLLLDLWSAMLTLLSPSLSTRLRLIRDLVQIGEWT